MVMLLVNRFQDYQSGVTKCAIKRGCWVGLSGRAEAELPGPELRTSAPEQVFQPGAILPPGATWQSAETLFHTPG